jgi:hypothetical protein
MTSVEPVTPPPASPPDPEAFSWRDYFSFNFMITPVFIRMIYLIGAVIITITAVFLFLGQPVTVTVNGETTTTGGGVLGVILLTLVYFVVAQLLWRIWMELLIVIFRIHGSLRAIETRGRGM